MSTLETIPHFIQILPRDDGRACLRFKPEQSSDEIAGTLARVALALDGLIRSQEIRGTAITNVDGIEVKIEIPNANLPKETRERILTESLSEFVLPGGWRV
jgi:hypothetical protein